MPEDAEILINLGKNSEKKYSFYEYFCWHSNYFNHFKYPVKNNNK